MNRSQIEYVLVRFLPEGWKFEQLLIAETDAFEAIVRFGRERARRVTIPADVLQMNAESAVNAIIDAIDQTLGLGRFATTPIVAPSPEWSPYP
jgi:hypothetical protein